jgi:TRAP-type C4-dicarboxylate transport system permease small subunit
MSQEPAQDLPTGRQGPASWLARVLGNGVAWLFLVAVILSAIEVVMRYVFGEPSSWSNPTVTFLCAIGFGLGGTYTMAEDGHVRISVLADRFPAFLRRCLNLLALAIGAFYLAGFGWGLWIQAQESVWRFGPDGWRPELTPGPPNWPLPAFGKSVLLIAALLFLAVIVERLVAHIRSRS